MFSILSACTPMCTLTPPPPPHHHHTTPHIQITSFPGEEFKLNIHGSDELGHFTAVVLQLSDAMVSHYQARLNSKHA